MENIDLSKIKKVHFAGIGGIGVSAMARLMLSAGKIVSGSDCSESIITKELEKLGAKIFLEHKAENVADDVDLFVYTPAVNEGNSEMKQARESNIQVFSYPEMLGLVSKDRYTIAVSGTHGKTTTTAMIGKIFMEARRDPTIIVGSLLKDQKSNFVAGRGEYFIVEACEYKKSFLNLDPKILVITNIDNDHLDYYGNLENIKKAFSDFAAKLPKNGYLVCDPNDKNLKTIVKKTEGKIIDYTKIEGNFNLKIPGGHNINNAKAALATAKISNIKEAEALKSLNNFSGTWRRFEYKGKTKNGVLVYDDYAHHPTEIRATLNGSREFFGDKKIWCVFQPHLYSRTKLLMDDFSKSFSDADEIILADIYAAREPEDKNINSKILAKKILDSGNKAMYLGSLKKIEQFLAQQTRSGDVVITMGAGNVYKIGDDLLGS